MRKHLVTFTLSTILVAPITANSLTYEWPVTTDVEVFLTSANTATYKLHMGKMQINDPTIDEWTTVREVVTKTRPAMCNNTYTCDYSTFHRHNTLVAGVATAPTLSYQKLYNVNSESTFQAIAANLALNYSTGVLTMYHNGSPNGGECVGAGLVAAGYNEPFDKAVATRLWNPPMAAFTCLGTPPVNQWCALTEPAITLNFGSQTLDNARSAQAKTSTRVECTTGMKYTLRLRGQDAIPLDNGMEARLTADSQALGSTLNGVRGLNTVTLGATLDGTPQAGSLNGSGVLYVSYP